MAGGSGIAAGAQAGAAFGPWGAAAGALFGGVTDMVSGSGGGPFLGGSSGADSFGTTMDGSGWVVNVQGRQDTTQSLQRTSSASPNLYDSAPQWSGAAAPPALAGMSGATMLLLLGTLAGFVLLRKRRG